MIITLEEGDTCLIIMMIVQRLWVIINLRTNSLLMEQLSLILDNIFMCINEN